jgi:hypothetical protein
MLASSLSAGFRALRARPGLVVLLFAFNLVLAFVLAVPIGAVLGSALEGTGFDADLAERLDIVLLTDILVQHGSLFRILAAQLFWIVPVVLAWKAAFGVGLVHALRDDGTGSFWTGVGRYFGRSFGLALLYLVPVGFVLFVCVLAGLGLDAISGEVGTVRTWTVVVPAFVAIGLAKMDLFQDYGRIAIVVEDRGVFAAFVDGVRFTLRHWSAFLLYLLWLLPAALLWLFPTVLEAALGASLGVFLLQQILMFLRAGATVGWIGSEVAFFESAASPAREGAEMPIGFA